MTATEQCPHGRERLNGEWCQECDDRPRAVLNGEISGRSERTPKAYGLLSHNPLISHEEPAPELGADAHHGPIGEAVRIIAEESEADPAAILLQALAGAGALIGPTPHLYLASVQHPAKLFVVIVGDTARARKGTSWGGARLLLDRLDPGFFGPGGRVLGGFGSGEAVVDEVTDGDAGREIPPAPDKRLLIHEPEFARMLKVAGRESSILSTVIRQGWETGALETRSRARRAVATGHHIAVAGHITAEELRKLMTDTEVASGFANRFLWVWARRAQRLPFGGEPDLQRLDAIAARIRRAIARARTVSRLTFAQTARPLWGEAYDDLGDDLPGGMLGSIVARSEAQVARLSLLYALVDEVDEIEIEHIEAALAVWDYCRASARHIWGDALGDSVADTLYRALVDAGPDGLTLTEQSKLFSGHNDKRRLDQARALLVDKGLAESVDIPTGGRPRTVHRAVPR